MSCADSTADVSFSPALSDDNSPAARHWVLQVSLPGRPLDRVDPSRVSAALFPVHCSDRPDSASVYIGLMFYCTYARQAPVFLIGAIMELPTFDLSISNLFPQIRNDLRFLSSFFLIRILFHAFLLADCVRPSSRAITQNSWIPMGTLSLAFVLHASWFHGGVKGYLRRHAKGQAMGKITATEHLVDDQMEILAEVDPLAYEALEGLEPGTPEDSPLVTPYTPKTYPMLSNLPTLPNFPTMPHIPSVSIPSLSDLTAALPAREQLDFGFKHAVKSRWEEQKDRFAGMRQGGGMRMNLDRVGFRRRGEGGVEMEEDDDTRR